MSGLCLALSRDKNLPGKRPLRRAAVIAATSDSTAESNWSVDSRGNWASIRGWVTSEAEQPLFTLLCDRRTGIVCVDVIGDASVETKVQDVWLAVGTTKKYENFCDWTTISLSRTNLKSLRLKELVIPDL